MTLRGFHECQRCDGTGLTMESCRELKAKGERRHACIPGCRPSDCPTCGGAGQVPDDDTVDYAMRQATVRTEYGTVAPSRTDIRAALFAYARHTQETKP